MKQSDAVLNCPLMRLYESELCHITSFLGETPTGVLPLYIHIGGKGRMVILGIELLAM